MIKNIDMKKVFKFIFLSTVIIIAFNYVVSAFKIIKITGRTDFNS